MRGWVMIAKPCRCRALSEEQAPDNPWRIGQGALFGRLDQFIARIGQLQAVFTAAAQFMRLYRVEIGSTKVQMECLRGSARLGD